MKKFLISFIACCLAIFSMSYILVSAQEAEIEVIDVVSVPDVNFFEKRLGELASSTDSESQAIDVYYRERDTYEVTRRLDRIIEILENR